MLRQLQYIIHPIPLSSLVSVPHITCTCRYQLHCYNKSQILSHDMHYAHPGPARRGCFRQSRDYSPRRRLPSRHWGSIARCPRAADQRGNQKITSRDLTFCSTLQTHCAVTVFGRHQSIASPTYVSISFWQCSSSV